MTFGEKLCFLMEITNTSNISLSKETGIHTSAISLYKNGKRKSPRDKEILNTLADFFSTRIQFDYQRNALASASDFSAFGRSMSTEQLSSYILQWFLGHFHEELSLSERFTSKTLSDTIPSQNEYLLESIPINTTSALFSIEGKRQAFITFLNYVCDCPEIGNVYIRCEEDWTNIFADEALINYVMKLIIKILKKGNHIIHIINQPNYYTSFFDEIYCWIPAYLNGNIDAVYYPKIRDGIFCNSSLVFPGHITAYTSCLQSMVADPNSYAILSTEKSLIKAKEIEFLEYFSRCKPLMDIYTSKEEINTCFNRIINEPCSHIQKGLGLPMFSLPDYLILQNSDKSMFSPELLSSFLEDDALEQENIHSYTSIDICPLATADQIMKGIVPVITPMMKNGTPLMYTAKSYADHLRNVVSHMEKFPNYYFVPIPFDRDDSICIIVNNNSEALLIRTNEPSIVFDFTLAPLVTQLHDYLYRIADKISYSDIHRRKIISSLRDLINELDKLS